MKDLSQTQYFKVQNDNSITVKEIIHRVYKALSEKGYNPVNQIVGRSEEHT